MNKRYRLHYRANLIVLLLLSLLGSASILAAGEPQPTEEKVSLEESQAPGLNDVNPTTPVKTVPQEQEKQDKKTAPDNNVKPDNNSKEDKKNKEKEAKKNPEKNGNGNGDDANKPPKKSPLVFSDGDSELKFGVRLRMPEFFYGKNLRLLNDANPTDRVVFFRHTIDFNTEYWYGKPSLDYDLVYVKMTIRNRGIWGDPESIASTTLSPIKELDAVFGEHRHALPRHVLWIRELWIQLSLNDILCVPFCNHHYITAGAFPFELGRGIALGTAYAVDPSDLGFWAEPGIDQYAFGGKLSGDIIKDELVYDLYGAILNNLSDTFDNTNQKIRGQEFGYREDQARGFGIINYVVAARAIWTPLFTHTKTKMRLEPYIMYNHNPEQKVEFIGDAKSNLCTLGVAGEFELGNFECGFDTAFNVGKQSVYGWDRNSIKLENRDGVAVIVNSHVRQAPPGQEPNPRKSPLALKIAENQNIINVSAQAAGENGKVIGKNNHGTLINGLHRFTEPSNNLYRGMMIVYDMGYYVCKPDVKVCAGFGYASGDANPNRDLTFHGDSDINQVYEGFIGLQEAYAGTRVKSAYLLSGQGKIPRPLSFPTQAVYDPYAVVVNRFTNLVFAGASGYWRPSWSCRKWSFNPNIIAFWTDYSSRFFNEDTGRRSRTRFARNYLGLEVNAFLEAELLQDLKFFTIASIFFPGSHYRDIEGLPLNKAQRFYLDNLDVTGIINDRVPLLGHDTSYFINVGLEYRF